MSSRFSHLTQKTKLKVGKVKPKASNYTDTSFKAKSIVLNKQSLSVNAPSSTSQFTHHVSLLRSRSDAQRSESLACLTSIISIKYSDTQLPETTATLLPKLQPLLLDGAPAVRQQLLRLLKCIPGSEIRSHVDQLQLYIQAGLNHLSSDIRKFSLDVLAWLLECVGKEFLALEGGWTKTLDSLVGALGWQRQSTKATQGWSNCQRSATAPGNDNKAMVKRIAVLSQILNVGLVETPDLDGAVALVRSAFPLWNAQAQTLPRRPNAYARLNLFGMVGQDGNEALEDREDRQRVFAERYETGVKQGLDEVKKEGGEIGRVAATLEKALKQGLGDFDRGILDS